MFYILLNFYKPDKPLLTTAKISVQKLDSRESNINDTYTSMTLIYLY